MEEYERPLNPRTTLPQILITSKESIKPKEKKYPLYVKVQRQKHVMSAMDTLLTLFVVSPLIVGQWRGTWELMCIYSRVFPAWESFIFGGALHLSFAIVRDGLQDLIKFEKKTWRNIIIAYVLRRLYTYLFAVACIMNWRGGWDIFDQAFAIEALPDGRALPGDHVPFTFGVFVISIVLLGLLRSCRNLMAAPFVIGLDTKSTAFDFPTRFRKTFRQKTCLVKMKDLKWPSDFGLYKQAHVRRKSFIMKVAILGTALLLLLFTISYTALYAVNNKPIENSAEKNTSNPKAEKLAASQVTVEKQVVQQISPHPFVNDLRGASPAGFFPKFAATTTTNYPQIANHRAPAHPNNIQDIIQYLSENAHRQKELIREEQNFATTNRERDKFQLFGTIQSSRAPHRHHQETQHSQHSFNRHLPQDPFFAYKPQDPSDINLLAPTSFRFAPAILSSGFYRNRQKLLQEATQAVNETSNQGVLKKPLSLTLNIYPSPFENAFANRDKFQGPGITPRYRYPFAASQTARNVATPGRMVVHLNVYPGAGNKFANSEESQEHRIQTGRNIS